MITVQRLVDNYLVCVICSEVFANPATLQCDHTFCRPCLLKYTKTQPEAVQAKSIPCPVCRQKTKVTSPDSHVSEWVNEVTPSQVIQNLKDLLGPGTQEGSACSVCPDGRETTPATSWCSDCEASFCDSCLQYHRRMPLSRKHLVCSLSEGIKLKTKADLKCNKHIGEQIHHFCTDCMAALCTKCQSMYHNHCQNVLLIMDTLPEGQVKTGPTQLRLSARGKSIQGISNSDTDKVEHQIRQSCQNAISVILEREKKLIAEVNAVRKEQTKGLEVELYAEEAAMKSLQQKLESVDQALQSGCEKDLLESYELCKIDIDEEVETARGAFRPMVPAFTATVDDLKTAIAEVMVSTTVVVGNDANDSAAVHDSIDVAHIGDKDEPYLTDVSVIIADEIKRILVTDWNNNKLKCVVEDNGRHHVTFLQFESSPFSVTQHDPTHVIVTLPSSRKIWKISVDPRLSLSSMISTKLKYYGIACLSGKRLAACTESRTSLFRNSASVDILDMRGTVLQSFKSRAIPSPVFLWSTSCGDILVSDMKSKTLATLSPKGKVVITYKPSKPRVLARPRGVAASRKGIILLVDGDSNKVIQLTKTGDYVRDLLTSADGLDKPCGICIDDDELIYVTSGQFIKVFRFLYFGSKHFKA